MLRATCSLKLPRLSIERRTLQLAMPPARQGCREAGALLDSTCASGANKPAPPADFEDRWRFSGKFRGRRSAAALYSVGVHTRWWWRGGFRFGLRKGSPPHELDKPRQSLAEKEFCSGCFRKSNRPASRFVRLRLKDPVFPHRRLRALPPTKALQALSREPDR